MISPEQLCRSLQKRDVDVRVHDVNVLLESLFPHEKRAKIKYADFLDMLKVTLHDDDDDLQLTSEERERHANDVMKRLQKLVMKAKKHGVDYAEVFFQLDKNNDGIVDKGEFLAGLADIGIVMTAKELKALRERFSATSGGYSSR